MENYKKGKNVEEPLTKDKIPIKNLPENFIWMQVRGGSKMRNLLDYALKEFETTNSIVWTGSGTAIGKAISCAEIMKRKFTLHQINKICFRKVEEHWDPVLEDLDSLVVTREIPTIHILLSKDSLDATELGYQAPAASYSWKKNSSGYQKKDNTPKIRIDRKQFESLGLRSGNKKRMKNFDNNKTKNENSAKHSKKNSNELEVAAESSVNS